MKTSRLTVRFLVALAAAWLSASASASALFDGSNPELWVLDPDRQTMYGVDAGGWVLRYQQGNNAPVYPLSGTEQVLVNGLAESSTPMTLGQPAISIAGLAPAMGSASSPAPAPLLRVSPDGGSYGGTIAIRAGLSPQALENSAVRVVINIAGQERVNTILCGTDQPPACQLPEAFAEGYRGVTTHLIGDGSAQRVTVRASETSGRELAVVEREYTIISDDPKGRRRDTDGDGIPDEIELAFGNDPLSQDLDRDRDGDGWSDFDEWLRDSDLDSETGQPLDTDEDGWSDFDERLRGTREDDPVDPQLTPEEGENEQTDPNTGEVLISETYRARTQRYKEFPSARRLYETEYLPSMSLVSRPGLIGRWINAAAHSLDGTRSWRLVEQLDEAALSASTLSSNEFSESLLRKRADLELSNERLPVTRMPAGDGAVVEAWQATGEETTVYQRVLPARADATLDRFLDTDPQWDTVEEWKQTLITWLGSELTVPVDDPVDWPSTRVAYALQRMLSDEALVNNAPAPILFNDTVQPLARDWLPAFVEALRLGGVDGIGAVIKRLETAFEDDQAGDPLLLAIADFIDEQAHPEAVPAEQYSDIWVARRLVDSFVPPPQGCLISQELLEDLQSDDDAFAEFQSRCPEFATNEDALASAEADDTRRYQLRLLLVVDPSVIAANPDLLVPGGDVDGDQLDNDAEIALAGLPDVSDPQLADTDGDGRNDGTDACPRDRADLCLGLPSDPQLSADSAATVSEGPAGNAAVVSFTLDRVVRFPLTVDYEAASVDDDTATAGADYTAVRGSLLIPAGIKVGLVRIPIVLDDESEDPETFRLLVTGVSDVVSQIPDNQIPVTIIDFAVDGPSDPPTAIAAAPAQVNAGTEVSLDGSASEDPLGQGLDYQWQQTAGPMVMLVDADTAVARFTAPNVGNVSDLSFQLAVTDANDRSASDSVTVRINPVDQPPEVIAPAEFSVAQGDSLRVEDTDLFEFVREPDGDPLTLVAFNGGPEGGRFSADANGFDFEPFTGSARVTVESTSGLTAAGPNHAAYIKQGDSGSELGLYDARSGSEQIVPGASGAGNVKGSQTQPLLYFSTSGLAGFELFQHQIGGMTRSFGSGGPNDLENGSYIEESTGDLYFCNGANWVSFAADTGQSLQSPSNCTGSSFESLSVQRGDRLCVSEGDTLYCSDRAGTLSLVQQFPGTITEMLPAGDELLVSINDFANGYQFFRLDSADMATLLLQTGDSAFPAARGVSLDDGSVVFGISDANDAMVLYRWPGGDTPPIAISQAVLPDNDRFDAGSFAADGTRVYWLLSVNGMPSREVLYEIDVAEYQAPVRLAPREIFDTEVDFGGAPFDIRFEAKGPDTGVEVLVRDPNDGTRCNLQLVDPDEPDAVARVRQKISDVRCQPSYVAVDDGFDGGDTLLYVVQEAGPDFRRPIFRFDGFPLLGNTNFSAVIADPGDNRVNLPIAIEIQAP